MAVPFVIVAILLNGGVDTRLQHWPIIICPLCCRGRGFDRGYCLGEYLLGGLILGLGKLVYGQVAHNY